MAAELAEWGTFMQATGAAVATIRLRIETMSQLLRHAGKTDPASLTRRDVLAYMSRPVKPWTLTTYWRCIRAWDVWAREFGYISTSIVQGIPAPKTPHPVARPLTDEEIKALLAAPLSRRARAFVILGLFAALRVHEIAQIKGEHFDLASGWLLVAGKGGVVKPVPIHPRVAQLAAEFPEQGFWFGSTQRPGEHVDPRSVSLTVRNAMELAGIHATAHRLRDTCATRFQRQVKDLRLTQALLRHASISTTQKYIAVSDTALQQAVSQITWDAA
jgi:site-specific recombinase XerD